MQTDTETLFQMTPLPSSIVLGVLLNYDLMGYHREFSSSFPDYLCEVAGCSSVFHPHCCFLLGRCFVFLFRAYAWHRSCPWCLDL